VPSKIGRYPFLETQNPFFKSGAILTKLATFVPHVTWIPEQVRFLGSSRLVNPLFGDPEPIFLKSGVVKLAKLTEMGHTQIWTRFGEARNFLLLFEGL